ncbi:MAG: TIGR04133 family radical SAM/SPASM protein [Bacteroidales bacterium]|nr:TIGR04133 family radical SAM/SPASM protein [Bacteroidales bacterium]
MLNQIKKKIFQQIKKFETKQHELNYLFWECTTRCNLNCLHCGSDCSKDSAFKDMPLNDFLKALDTIKNPSSNFTVVLTGGEPLMRKDIEQCGRAIRQRGMKWSMVSNGHFYTPEKHNALLNAGMGALTISLDGMEPLHNWLRNNATSFSKVDNAISLAVSAKRLNFDVVTCVNRRNISELQSIFEFLMEKGVKSWRLFTIIPIGRAATNPEMLLSDSEFKQLMDFITIKRKEKEIAVNFSCEGYVGDYETKVRDSYFFCRAGINIGSILIDGSIMACPNIDRSFSQGNINQDNFFEIWQSKYQAFRDRSWTKKGECASCNAYKDCQGNGFHNWHGAKENVLVCHNKKILNANFNKE